ncbi:hypothetical protein [Corallococcus aberystwythensis]|uniref:Uncharacterized protein n=1 Tax=Corallococcus aberystwythensis TaxID=2316722 RepID=A0A3A8Q295_9BACT|nr:hypothetical protein [Corallococcus aberystwythensis]RKH57464.1 hypothetical protein D7W81_31155 [Corallococcus aberystwythensis]
MPHHQDTAPKSRLRHWASRLALLVACVSVVATSQATSESVSSAPYTGAPRTLTSDAPRVTIPLVMRATTSKSPDKFVEAEMLVEFKLRWTPADPNQTEKPVFRAMLRESGTDFSGQENYGPVTAGRLTPLDVRMSLPRDCKLGTRCEWLTDLNLELQANGIAGTLEVEWTATGSAFVVDTSSTPRNFTVTLSEP